MAVPNLRSLETVLRSNRAQALQSIERMGQGRTLEVLRAAQADLESRLRALPAREGQTFTETQLRSTLAQVRIVIKDVQSGLKSTVLDVGKRVAKTGAAHTYEYLAKASQHFEQQPLALNEASILEEASDNVSGSILRRLASSGEPTSDIEPHPAKQGILQRYGMNTIQRFENRLQVGLVARKSWIEIRQDITDESPFLQAAPAHWAQRIVRTESLGSYNRAGWEATRLVDDELEDMVKILSATFDDRTGADSFAVHGQIRRPDEAFETWFGMLQTPPARPNDREIVVPHRIAWPLPPYLAWRDGGQIASRWKSEGRKGSPPERPEMTTVPLEDFGHPQGRRAKRGA